MDNDIDFNSPVYEADPRFTAGLSAEDEDPDFYAHILTRQTYIRESGYHFFGHSSAELVELALSMPVGSLATTYRWPVPFDPAASSKHEIDVSRYAHGAYDYALAYDHQTLLRLGLPIEDYYAGITSTPAAQTAYERIKALNVEIAALNPSLQPAYQASLDYEKQGFQFNTLNFLWGAVYKFPAEDILLFQHVNAARFFHSPSNETNLGIDIWEEYRPYFFKDAYAGWVMSQHTATKILDAVISLKADGTSPYKNYYFDQNANYPFQQAFEQVVVQKHAEYLAGLTTEESPTL